MQRTVDDAVRRTEVAEGLADERLKIIDDLLGSASWRVTAPLRAATRAMGSRRAVEPHALPAPSSAESETRMRASKSVPTGGFAPTAHERHGLWRKPWREGPKPPPPVYEIPAMITDDERELLYWLSRDHWSGAGRILDAGCYLGGSTSALAAGLADRPERPQERVIASYDRFLVDYFMRVNLPDDPDLDEGESFRPAFDRNIAPYEDLVEVREGDIVTHGWSGEPIEIAFLDVLKSWRVNDFVLEAFFGSMIPGRTLIVQQDFVYEFSPWIHVTMGMLDPYVELLDLYEWGCAVYLLREPIPEEVLRTKTRSELRPEQMVGHMERAIAPATGEIRGVLEVTKAMLLRLVEGSEAMEAQLSRIGAEYDGSIRVARAAEMIESWGKVLGYGPLKLYGREAGTSPAEWD